VTVTLARINEIREAWLTRSGASPESVADPIGALAGIIDEETQPERRAALEAVRGEFLSAERLRNEARVEALKSTLFAGAVQIVSLTEARDRIELAGQTLADYREFERVDREAGDIASADLYAAEIPAIEAALARHERSYALSVTAFERLLVTAASEDFTPTLRRQARDVLELEMESAGLGDMLPVVRSFATATDTFAREQTQSLPQIIESVILR
jgi:hypothetical protein